MITNEAFIQILKKRAIRFFHKLLVAIKRGGWAPLLLLILAIGIPGTINEIHQIRPQPADLYFLNLNNTYSVGQSFPVEIRVKTNGTAINAMGFTANFNPQYLEVTGMTTENSFCTHYLDNNFNNVDGYIKLSCGTPRPGFQGDSLAVRLTVRTKLPGTPEIKVDPNTIMLLANDGKGSRIVRDTPIFMMNVQQL